MLSFHSRNAENRMSSWRIEQTQRCNENVFINLTWVPQNNTFSMKKSFLLETELGFHYVFVWTSKSLRISSQVSSRFHYQNPSLFWSSGYQKRKFLLKVAEKSRKSPTDEDVYGFVANTTWSVFIKTKEEALPDQQVPAE